MAGVKAKVKDSADGLVLRESPSTKAKPVESLAAGTVLNVLADPAGRGGADLGESLPRHQSRATSRRNSSNGRSEAIELKSNQVRK